MPTAARSPNRPAMLARRFLGCIFVLIILAVIGAFAFFQFGDAALTKFATPQGHYAPPPPSSGPDYADKTNWLARPDVSPSPADWLPDGFAAEPIARTAATFYIHPTTYLDRDRWNAPLVTTGETAARTHLFVRSQASAFNGVSEVWAPRYRQAAFGAFLLTSADADKALDLAYRDVLAAFDAFLAAHPADKPIILAGHSQGSLHLLRLLADRRDALKGRLVAAYVVGWPVSAAADLPATGLPACNAAEQVGCVLSWQSFKDPANPALIMDAWNGTTGLSGAKRKRGDMVCTNPLTGGAAPLAPPSANPGTLVPTADLSSATVTQGIVGAACEDGILIVDGAIPPMGPYVLPGNNFHVYDYALFWGAIRADAARRVAAFAKR